MSLEIWREIFTKNRQGIESVHLFDTDLVVEGLGFAAKLSDEKSIYGGEYLEYALRIRKALNDLEKCGIIPHFIFSGFKQVTRFGQKRMLDITSYFLGECAKDHNRSANKQPPIDANSVLIDVLREMKTSYINTLTPTLRSSCSLAAFLQCPVAGYSPMYFVMTPIDALVKQNIDYTPTELKYVMLDSINLTPLPKEDSHVSSSNYYMQVDILRPEVTDLNRIHPSKRPLLAALHVSGIIPSVRLPKSVYLMHYPNDESLRPTERRIKMLLEWLSLCPPESWKPLEEVFACYPQSESQTFIQELSAAFSQNFYRPAEEGRCLAEQLDVRVPADARSNQTSKPQLRGQFSEIPDINNIFELLQCGQLERDYTADWPPRLIHAFRNSLFDCRLLSAVYGDGLYLSWKHDNLNSFLSIHEASLPIRVMHYRVLAGLEHRLNRSDKLIGLSPHATEYMRRGNKLFAYHIPVKPLDINPENEHTDYIVGQLFHSSLNNKFTEPEWSFSLSTTLTLAHKFFQQMGNGTGLEESSVILATALCAVLTGNNLNSIDDEVCKHYSELTSDLQPQDGNTLGPVHGVNEPSKPELVEKFNEIQVVHHTLRSLVSLIDSLLPSDRTSEKFSFLPTWAIFPSGRLVYWLADHIDSYHPKDRLQAVIRYWLPQVQFLKPKSSLTSNTDCTVLADQFERVIRTSMELDIRLDPIIYELCEFEPSRIHEIKLRSISASTQ
ncbi:unnamed protein product [Calicophoron daubneyi]|uniref:XPG N-terminal domain-containing protein n=1 Tax=Calicophoron daubneyi TaxID=300641 RepID=A0AAV2TSK2_CALDB